MAVFKCKMCGGSLQVEQGRTVGICDYCGTEQTLPRLDDERRIQMYERANHFRRNNDYDKAAGIYETILNEDITDAEAYWSLVLCKYGVEYVEDPETKKRVVTCNRTQLTSVLADEDYKQALANADGDQRSIYIEEAQAIDRIQKGILEISQREEPFDVFICYKETDERGQRTRDSVIAQELYHELTREGFKVFFSRITLENIIGAAYEPYIFAALNSSKVMIVIGTKPENFNAVWVKNEWNRYLASIKDGAKKVLIPAYRDMDAYDLPEEFSHLQAQDMNKLGFVQDIIRGIKKITGTDTPKPSVQGSPHMVTNMPVGGNTATLIKRGNIFLDDGNFTQAQEYFNRALDFEPENSSAYIGLLCAEMKLKHESDLSSLDSSISENTHFKNALRFAGEEQRERLQNFEGTILENVKKKRQEELAEIERYKKEEQERKAAKGREAARNLEGLKRTLTRYIIAIPGSFLAMVTLDYILELLNLDSMTIETFSMINIFVIVSCLIMIAVTQNRIRNFKKEMASSNMIVEDPPPDAAVPLGLSRKKFSFLNALLFFITVNIPFLLHGIFGVGIFKSLIQAIVVFVLGLASKKPLQKKSADTIMRINVLWAIMTVLLFRISLRMGNTITLLLYAFNIYFLSDLHQNEQTAKPLTSSLSKAVDTPETTRVCESCGAQLQQDSRFCEKCGAKVDS